MEKTKVIPPSLLEDLNGQAEERQHRRTNQYRWANYRLQPTAREFQGPGTEEEPSHAL